MICLHYIDILLSYKTFWKWISNLSTHANSLCGNVLKFNFFFVSSGLGHSFGILKWHSILPLGCTLYNHILFIMVPRVLYRNNEQGSSRDERVERSFLMDSGQLVFFFLFFFRVIISYTLLKFGVLLCCIYSCMVGA